MSYKRKKIWIDRFQTILSLRIAAYFILYQITLWVFASVEHYLFPRMQISMGTSIAINYLLLLAVASVMLGGLFVYDGIKLTHRIVGPLYRFRQTMKAITAGDEIEMIRLRKGDYLQEMKEDFNDMIKALEHRAAVTLKPSKQEARKPVSV
jgi:sensor histidine kinase YesM